MPKVLNERYVVDQGPHEPHVHVGARARFGIACITHVQKHELVHARQLERQHLGIRNRLNGSPGQGDLGNTLTLELIHFLNVLGAVLFGFGPDQRFAALPLEPLEPVGDYGQRRNAFVRMELKLIVFRSSTMSLVEHRGLLSLNPGVGGLDHEPDVLSRKPGLRILLREQLG